MSRPLPFTKASIRRAVAGAREAGLRILEIKPDGSIVVDDGQSSPSLAPISLQNDPYVAAIDRGIDAKTPRKRHVRP